MGGLSLVGWTGVLASTIPKARSEFQDFQKLNATDLARAPLVLLEHYDNITLDYKVVMDRAQSDMNCCGLYGEYDGYMNYKEYGDSVPDSCCIKQSEGCGNATLKSDP